MQGIVYMMSAQSPTSTCLSTEMHAHISIDGSRPLLQSQSSTTKNNCDRPDVRTTELLPDGPPTDLNVSETADGISETDMAVFTEVVKRGKQRAPKSSIAPPDAAVVMKTRKSHRTITGRGVGVGIEAAKRSGWLSSVFASRLAPDLTDAVLMSYLDIELGLSVTVECE